MKRLNFDFSEDDLLNLQRGMTQTGLTSIIAHIRHCLKLSASIYEYISKGYQFQVVDQEGNTKEVIFL